LKSESHDHGSSNADLSMSSRRRLDAMGHSSRKYRDYSDVVVLQVVNDFAFPRGTGITSGDQNQVFRQRNDCDVSTRRYGYLRT